MLAKFLPTPSARRATVQGPLHAKSYRAISTHALREEGDKGGTHHGIEVEISTHALREEGDPGPWKEPVGGSDFYPRPPRGGRPCRSLCTLTRPRFLPTPSARRATRCLRPNGRRDTFLPTPSARRATDLAEYCECLEAISTHALREEGDVTFSAAPAPLSRFLPTPSARRATRSASSACTRERHFYPRPPRGGRQFLLLPHSNPKSISTHALREEGDARRSFTGANPR